MNVPEALSRKVIQQALNESFGREVIWDFGPSFDTKISEEEKEREANIELAAFLNGDEAALGVIGFNGMIEVQLETGSEPYLLVINRHESF